MVVQPKLGTSFSWPSSLQLGLGLGLLLVIPASEGSSEIGGRGPLSPVGYVAHRLVPILEVSIGFAR